jgi:hypothetical protein
MLLPIMEYYNMSEIEGTLTISLFIGEFLSAWTNDLRPQLHTSSWLLRRSIHMGADK